MPAIDSTPPASDPPADWSDAHAIALAEQALEEGCYAVGDLFGKPVVAIVDPPDDRDLPRTPTLISPCGHTVAFFGVDSGTAMRLAMEGEL